MPDPKPMTHEIKTETFADNSRRALLNAGLQRAMSKATEKFIVVQQGLDESGEEWQQLRTRGRAIKEHTLENLDYYLEQFAANVERHGGRVCWARDAEEANRYICELARTRGVSLAVKAKSMMSEEIELNRALASAGVEAVETDFGEYIAQLAGERPSHINMPIVHKSRADVADLFKEKLKVERTEEIKELAGIARRLLRERFAEAELGITGVNFAVAESGSVVLVENEGNIRFTTSLPRVQVALMGIEKVIPRVADLEVFLKLLPQSASGQKITAGVSVLTGVRRAPHEEGPDEFHVVILDNGRTGILADPHLRESLYCIRCGACLNVCPVYRKIGGHAYGWVYPGPIGAVLTPPLIGRERSADLPFASTLCGACRDVCPVKIKLPEMLLHLRAQIKESPPDADPPPEVGDEHRTVAREPDRRAFGRRLSNFAERAAFKLWAALMKDARRYRRSARLARLAERALGGAGRRFASSILLSRWTATRDLPTLAPRPFSSLWGEISAPPSSDIRNDDEKRREKRREGGDVEKRHVIR
jgi:L-lactate dehydrogenase complex protein LldF